MLDDLSSHFYSHLCPSEKKKIKVTSVNESLISPIKYEFLRRLISFRTGIRRNEPTNYYKNVSPDLYHRYKEYFTTPYFIFVRDTLSYLVLLGLHLVICFEPSQLSFSGLEWVILTFFFGRLLMELNQVADKKQTQKYLRCVPLLS